MVDSSGNGPLSAMVVCREFSAKLMTAAAPVSRKWVAPSGANTDLDGLNSASSIDPLPLSTDAVNGARRLFERLL